jgi:hypothetical protein
MRRPIHNFNLDDASEQAHLAVCELYNTPEFQNVSFFREQISVAIDYMRTDDLLIPFSQIAGIFRVERYNHPTLLKESKREETRRAPDGGE